MAKADKLFEEMGYTKKEKEERIEYILDDFLYIVFYKDKERFNSFMTFNAGVTTKPVQMQELKAIVEKCKELGWYD